MLIKIIKGSYGYRPILPNGQKSPYVIRITPGHSPIEVEDAEGDRLIAAGDAEKVQDEKSPIPEVKAAEGAKEAVSEPAVKKGKKQKETPAEEVTD